MTQLNFKSFTIDSATLPAKAIDYLLQYGFSKSMNDAVSGMKKALGEAGKTEAEIEAEILETWQSRFDDICKGEVGTRVGTSRKSSAEKMREEVTMFLLKAAVAAKGKKLPKDKEQLASLISRWAEKNEDAIAKEISRREKLAKAASADLDDLFDDL